MFRIPASVVQRPRQRSLGLVLEALLVPAEEGPPATSPTTATPKKVQPITPANRDAASPKTYAAIPTTAAHTLHLQTVLPGRPTVTLDLTRASFWPLYPRNAG